MDSIKVFVVTCGECKEKLILDTGTKYKECDGCDSVVVMQTSSQADLQLMKKNISPDSRVVFSNYMVYSLFPNEVERIVAERRIRIKQEKDEIEQRRSQSIYASDENAFASSNRKSSGYQESRMKSLRPQAPMKAKAPKSIAKPAIAKAADKPSKKANSKAMAAPAKKKARR